MYCVYTANKSTIPYIYIYTLIYNAHNFFVRFYLFIILHLTPNKILLLPKTPFYTIHDYILKTFQLYLYLSRSQQHVPFYKSLEDLMKYTILSQPIASYISTPG